MVNAQWHDTAAHTLVNFHTLVRFSVKMEFVAGLALKLARAHGIHTLPPVQTQLGAEVALLGARSMLWRTLRRPYRSCAGASRAQTRSTSTPR